ALVDQYPQGSQILISSLFTRSSCHPVSCCLCLSLHLWFRGEVSFLADPQPSPGGVPYFRLLIILIEFNFPLNWIVRDLNSQPLDPKSSDITTRPSGHPFYYPYHPFYSFLLLY